MYVCVRVCVFVSVFGVCVCVCMGLYKGYWRNYSLVIIWIYLQVIMLKDCIKEIWLLHEVTLSEEAKYNIIQTFAN